MEQSYIYITFGQEHTHENWGKVFDKDCVAKIPCNSYTQGRELAFALFNKRWCMAHTEEPDQAKMKKYFKRGFIEFGIIE